MRHALARQAIGEVLRSPAIDARSLALVQSAQIADHPMSHEDDAMRLLAHATAFPVLGVQRPDRADPFVPGDDLDTFIERSLQAVTDRPVATAIQLASLSIVVELWPHAARDERYHLQRAWLFRHACASAPQGSWATRTDLETWQRAQPTMHECDEPAPGALLSLLDEKEPEAAYHQIAAYLGPNVDLAKLYNVLGSVASRSLLHRFDHGRGRQIACLATIVGGRLSQRAPADLAITLLAQLCHEIWWHHANDTRPLFAGSDDPELTLEEAIAAGDFRGAQRTARQSAHDPDRIFRLVFKQLRHFVDQNSRHWPRLVNALTIVQARRSGGTTSPDDIALLAAVTAAVTWLTNERQPV